MGESVYLHGSEDVSRAGRAMRDAADQMQTAANTIDEALRQHRIFLDDWLARLAETLAVAGAK